MNSLLTTTGLKLLNRRQMLGEMGTALGSLGLLHLLASERLLAQAPEKPAHFRPAIDPTQPTRDRSPQFPAAADQLLIIFCAGAVSQVDSWDYKPELIKSHGQEAPNGPKVTFQGPPGKLSRPFWEFKPRGDCGKPISELFPRLAELADEICFVHSLTSPNSAHTQAENFLSTGFVAEGYPSLGAWTSYALGSPNDNLPAFVSIPDPRGVTEAGSNNWGAGFLPAVFQGTNFNALQLRAT